MAKKGGARPGAGRPVGSTSRIRVSDLYNEKELKEFWDSMKERAKTDNKIGIFMAEQMTGKAVQAVEVGGEGGGPLKIDVVNYADNNRPV